MFDEGTNRMLNNKELMELMMESVQNDEFYISEGAVSHSLEECLMSASDDVLKMFYLTHHTFEGKKVKEKDLVREKMIEFLTDKLLEYFESFLDNIQNDEIKLLDAYCKNKETIQHNMVLLSNGFMFAFREEEKNVYVIPDEYIDIYKKIFTKSKKVENTCEKLHFYVISYLIINGMVPKKFFNDLMINYYNLDLSVKEIEEFIKSTGINIYKNKYYSVVDEVESSVLEDLVKLQKNESYCVLNEIELLSYKNFTSKLVEDLSKVIKVNFDDLYSRAILILSVFEEDVECYLDRFVEEFNLNDKQLKKVEKIIEDSIEDIRFWDYHGYTSNEYYVTLALRENAMLEVPSDTSLKACLEVLPSEVYDELSYNYIIANDLEDDGLSVDKLSQLIIEEFKIAYMEDSDYYSKVFAMIHDGMQNFKDIDISDIELGFVFSYYQDKKLIVVIPDEISDIIRDSFSAKFHKDEYVFGYLKLNGVLEKTRLQQLLKENHNIDLSIKELDRICKVTDIDIVDNKCYSIVDEEMIEGMLRLKNSFSVYKKLELFDSDIENDLFDDLDMFFEEFVDDEEKCEALTSFIVILLHSASYSDDILRALLEDAKVSIKEKYIKDLIDIIKKYKNDIAVWQYNGFTLKEYNDMKKVSKKIGRNEPCSCGSGKKYKKCCGK